jgi:enoyl-CoA hydratase/carnithine racemase
MTMLGRRYDAATLERWGLINRVVPDEELEGVALAIATELANGPTVAHAAAKKLVAVDGPQQHLWRGGGGTCRI